MTKTANAARQRLVSRVRGETRWFGVTTGEVPEAVTADFTATAQGEVLTDVGDQSLDTVAAIGALEACADPIARLREWRRVLRPGGQLLLCSNRTGNTGVAPKLVVGLLNALGGFQITTLDDAEADSFVLFAERSVVAGIRMPLGSMGPELAGLATADGGARAELYFQFGAMLLQVKDAPLAETCFQRSLGIDARSAESMFGLGMAHGMQDRWEEALESLQKAVALAPANGEAQRWLLLARTRCDELATTLADPT